MAADVEPGSYWDLAGNPLLRHRVERLIPTDAGPYVYARSVVTREGLVVTLAKWLQSATRIPLDAGPPGDVPSGT